MLFVNPLGHPTLILRAENLQRLRLQYDYEAEFAKIRFVAALLRAVTPDQYCRNVIALQYIQL
jgi:hypothetical protein